MAPHCICKDLLMLRDEWHNFPLILQMMEMDCAAILRMQDTEGDSPMDLRVARDTLASSQSHQWALDHDWHAISQLPLPSPPRTTSPLVFEIDDPWPSPPPPPQCYEMEPQLSCAKRSPTNEIQVRFPPADIISGGKAESKWKGS